MQQQQHYHHQQQHYQQQQQHHHQQVVVLTQAPPKADDSFRPNVISQIVGLSVTQILMGCFCVILGIAYIPTDASTDQGSDISICGYGIWLGAVFIFIGGMGISASKNKSSGKIVATMVLNIIFATIGSVVFVSMTSISLIISSSNRCVYHNYETMVWNDGYGFYNWDTYRYETVTPHYETQYNSRTICDENNLTSAFYAFDAMMLIMAIIELVVNIWTAALCCGAVCRCCKLNAVGAMVQFTAHPQQVMVQSAYNPAAYAPPSYASVPNYYGVAAPQQNFYPAQQQQNPVAVHGHNAPQASAPQTVINTPAPVPAFNPGRHVPLPPLGSSERPPPPSYGSLAV